MDLHALFWLHVYTQMYTFIGLKENLAQVQITLELG